MPLLLSSHKRVLNSCVAGPVLDSGAPRGLSTDQALTAHTYRSHEAAWGLEQRFFPDEKARPQGS